MSLLLAACYLLLLPYHTIESLAVGFLMGSKTTTALLVHKMEDDVQMIDVCAHQSKVDAESLR